MIGLVLKTKHGILKTKKNVKYFWRWLFLFFCVCLLFDDDIDGNINYGDLFIDKFFFVGFKIC